jgi:hypothetical protein
MKVFLEIEHKKKGEEKRTKWQMTARKREDMKAPHCGYDQRAFVLFCFAKVKGFSMPGYQLLYFLCYVCLVFLLMRHQLFLSCPLFFFAS